jgi:hypothetical protein
MLTKSSPNAVSAPPKDSKGGFSITVVHLGRKYYQMTLWASTYVNQRKWVETITKQQEVMKQRSMIFETSTISENFFVGVNRVNSAAPFCELIVRIWDWPLMFDCAFRWWAEGCVWNR